jgi:hypothetical protein
MAETFNLICAEIAMALVIVFVFALVFSLWEAGNG